MKYRIIIWYTISSLVCSIAGARELYVGGSASYALEQISDHFDYFSYDNSTGGSGIAGIAVFDTLAIEYNFEMLPNFECTYYGIPLSNIDVTTHMLAVKLSWQEGSSREEFFGYDPESGMRWPYFTVGFGKMKVHEDFSYYYTLITDTDITNYMETKNQNITDNCWKAGLGVDYFFEEHMSTGAQINYTKGMGDVDSIKYIVISINALYHF